MALAICLAGAQSATQPDMQFMAATPLGTDLIRLVPGNEVLSMLLTLESKELEGAKLVHASEGNRLIGRDGKDITTMPEELTFRFTVGSKTQLMEHDALETEFDGTVDEFQSTLRFRLKIFHGLDFVELEPESQKIVGVPADMPYDERIYRVRFKLPKNTPTTDRMMLQVFDSEDERVGRFPLQLL
jgi:hypothetical protein